MATGPATVRGQLYPHSVFLTTVGLGRRGFASYVIAGRYQTFVSSLGIDDRASSGARARLQIQADSKVIFERDCAQGEIVNVNLPISNVFRLTLSAISLVEMPTGARDPISVFGDAKLLGNAAT